MRAALSVCRRELFFPPPVSLPKTPETDGIFNAEILKILQDKYIVNVGRSNCIDQKALYEALQEERLGGAAIDTWDKKPQREGERLFPSALPFTTLENIVLSPHQAMRVEVGHARYVQDTQDKVLAYILRGEVRDVVDLKKGY